MSPALTSTLDGFKDGTVALSVILGSGTSNIYPYIVTQSTYVPSIARCNIIHGHLKSFASSTGETNSLTQTGCNWSGVYSDDCDTISFETNALRIYTVIMEYKLPLNVLIEKTFKVQVVCQSDILATFVPGASFGGLTTMTIGPSGATKSIELPLTYYESDPSRTESSLCLITGYKITSSVPAGLVAARPLCNTADLSADCR